MTAHFPKQFPHTPVMTFADSDDGFGFSVHLYYTRLSKWMQEENGLDLRRGGKGWAQNANPSVIPTNRVLSLLT